MGADTDTAQFADTLSARLASYGARPFVEFERKWHSGNDITDYIGRIGQALTQAGVDPGEPVGLVVRNRVAHAAAILGFVAAQRPVVMIYSYQSARSIARDIDGLGLPAVVLDREDWTPDVAEAVTHTGAAAVTLSWPTVGIVAVRRRSNNVHPGPKVAAAGLHILTSGTTGPPKRMPVKTPVLQHTMLSMTVGQNPSPDDPPELVYWPFGSIGVCQLLAGPYLGKRTVLLEKFSVDEFVRAIKTYGIKRTGVQPAILRMLLDADVAKEDLASLEYLPGGSAPLDPQLRDEFESRYGIPLLWAYGATEFAGSACAMTLDLYRRYGPAKRDTVGRPLPGVRVRIVDEETDTEVGDGDRGLLEARIDVVGPEWIRTTDLASVDADGFVTIHGRADGAIIRGGFKILPETVRRVLMAHPAVGDASVVGVADRRLGHVPFAAVETKPGVPTPSESELMDWVRESLPSHHVPVAITTVDRLPRNPALKVRPADVADLYNPR
ncbi:MAG: long-chain acyl-CoA synthetase [Mycobacterium sp.]|nr:long-chain acyl-CoA synthetase [Mycobacterium sp.]